MTASAFDPARAAMELAEFARRAAELLPALRAAGDDPEAGCARDAVWRRDKVTLYRYRAIAQPKALPPLLIVFALVNRPYILDLAPDRSLIRGLLAAGLDVYLIDWGCPDGADRDLRLADYIDGYLDGAVREILATHGIASLNLLGVCQGGTFSLCYTALHGDAVRNLVTMVTPVDFRTPENLLSRWVADIDIDLMAAGGNVPGQVLNNAFLALQPFRLTQQKYVDLVRSGASPARVAEFLRMERWIFDSPELPAALFRDYVKGCYQENRLVAGTLEIGERKVSLRAITQPVLNIYATQDHIVPPSASLPLAQHIATRDYTAMPVDVGHIGMYVSSRARDTVPPAIAAWLAARPAD
ncbi:MAG: Poly(3-hydroxyalkanoate) polymerase subunit PhaC [Steroidobacteraceae bacterium]|nr:Poly(3-hydroxyalkanoate) polymerase subunit PhaC [Steroidobacteraceae bacterium]